MATHRERHCKPRNKNGGRQKNGQTKSRTHNKHANTISDDALGKLFRALLLLEIKKRLETKSTETKSANE